MPEASTRPFRVLVVDDDPDMVAYLTRLLEQEGMAVETAASGTEALQRIGEWVPDLILLDVVLPGPSGFDICRTVKAREETALVPVVLVTALEDAASRIEGIEAGADDFLTKPVRREELLARMRTLRRLHETRRELEARRLAEEVQRKDAIRQTFARYLSPRLTERVLAQAQAGEDLFRNLSERTAVVVLFADLRNFTHLAEVVPVGKVVPMLNEFFTELTVAVHEHEGTVFSMAGDSLLVGFNVPVPQPDAAERALACARVMIERFRPIAARWFQQYGVRTGLGIGIEAGEVVVGNVGSPVFMSYTVIGDAVNVAARLMQAAGPDEILIGPRALLSLRPLLGQTTSLEHRELLLRGKATPVDAVAVRVAAS